MLDIKLLREEPDRVKRGILAKNADPNLVDAFLELDKEWRDATARVEELRAKQKEISRLRYSFAVGYGSAQQGSGGQAEKPDVEAGKKNKGDIREAEAELEGIEKEREIVWMQIPNLPSEDTPVGKDESGNVEIRKWGIPPKFNFAPKDHLELGEKLGIIDFESGAKIAGSGFYYLKNDGVLLELALVRYALDFLRARGFDLWFTPDVAREKFYLGTGYNPRGPEAQTYVIENSDLGLIATAEVTLAGLHADEVLAENELPKLYAGYSHCFRQESGAYGKYSRGLYRVHQFTKVEMFAYVKPEDSSDLHDKLLGIEEELWRGLGIPYRVLQMCAGDLGAQAARKFDLEAWMPGRDDWGEITSTSNTTDYQSRRLNIKFRRSPPTGGEFAHTLNGTAIATSRAIVAILENYQTADGKVEVPNVLKPYIGKDIIGQ